MSNNKPFVERETFELRGTPNTNYQRKFKSPVFRFSNSASILANGTKLFDYHRDNLSTEKYGSFNNLIVTNISSSPIVLYPNQDKNQGVFIASGTDKVLSESSIGSTSSILIENVGTSTITASQIQISIWKSEQEFESIVQRIHEKAFSPDDSLNKLSSWLGSTKKGGL